MIEIIVADLRFLARLETEKAPRTSSRFRAMLPLKAKIIQARWSGEAGWIPFGDLDLGLGYENQTSYPAPGHLLLYPGGLSETEILFPYGSTMFASKAGQLAGNHFATIYEGNDQLAALGQRVVWEGAQDITFEESGGRLIAGAAFDVSDSDLIIRGGNVVTQSGVITADIAVADGTITSIGPSLPLTAEQEIDAAGLHVFPGGIDSHVHFNEPGHTDWETIGAGSAALAAGGYTTFVDMPLNSLPVTVDAQAFDLKLKAATAFSLVDFGLWGGLVPGNLDRLEELAGRGVVGFKAFMCSSGLDEFPASDVHTLLEGMRRIAQMDSILLLHAESPQIIESLALQAMAAGRTGPRDFIRSRPPEAELEAISIAIALANDTGCRIHIVHVSTTEGVQMVTRAQAFGVDVTCETCPHYLLYSEDDLERLGGAGKCTPPFRTAEDRENLWRLLADGTLPMVVSDHSPSTPELKRGDDFFKVWGGISGCQSTRQLLLAHADERSIDLPTVAAVTATNPARRFRLARKGEIAVGFDADLWLADLSYEGVVRKEDLLYRNPLSTHEGQPIRGRTAWTLVRGRTVFSDGGPSSEAAGRLLRPATGAEPPR